MARKSWQHLYLTWQNEYRNGASIRGIAAKWDANTMSVRIALRGITRSRRSVALARPRYFETIDTDEKAYFLGLLVADGCIQDKRSGQRAVSLGLTQLPGTSHSGNEHTLIGDHFRRALGTDATVSEYPGKSGGTAYSITVVCDTMAADLIAHGVYPRKSKDKIGVAPTGVPDKHLAAFARGLFDGDGGFNLAARKNKQTGHISWAVHGQWSGARNVLAWLLGHMRALGIVQGSLEIQARATCMFVLARRDTERAIKWMYAAGGPFLLRKWKRAHSHPQDWEDTKPGQLLPPREQRPMTPSAAAKRSGKKRYNYEAIRADRLSGMAYKEIEAKHGCSRTVTLKACKGTQLPSGQRRIRPSAKRLTELEIEHKAKRAVLEALTGIAAPKPPPLISGVEIRQGDAFKILPELPERFANLILTDLPYSAEAHARAGRNPKRWHAPFTEADVLRVLGHCARLANRWVIFACLDRRFMPLMEHRLPDGLRFIRFGTWIQKDYKRRAYPGRPSQGWEVVALLHRRGVGTRWNGGNRDAVFEHSEKSSNGHPTAKPVALYREFIELFSDPGDLILDPFAGVGTTARAAAESGRRALCIELEERWVKRARRRLSRAIA